MISVLSATSGAAVLGAAALSGRWLLHQREELGRPRPFPRISVALLAVLGIALAVPVVRRHHEEDRLSRVASRLVGHRVKVHCQSLGQALTDVGSELGYVKYGEDGVPEQQTTIKRDPCGELRKYYGGNRHRPTTDEIIAVHVLTHESMHMRGLVQEDMAECAAVQRDEETAEMLGATPGEAAMLARLYWGTVYPDMPEGYTTPDCRPGGALDEHLVTSPWVRA
ncbi:MAG: hypothetical protein JWO22_344 [Frankiales bacterium]|nr:hypothetical protein [Frankiales bacterium]